MEILPTEPSILARCVLTKADNRNKSWTVEVYYQDNFEWPPEEKVIVQLNSDTIMCTLDGYPFNTYAWSHTGQVESEALIASIKYMRWLDTHFVQEDSE